MPSKVMDGSKLRCLAVLDLPHTMSPYIAPVWLWVVPVVLILLARAIRQCRRYSNLLPGPIPLRIVGNILDFPQTHLSREFSALSERFGAYTVRYGGTPVRYC